MGLAVRDAPCATGLIETGSSWKPSSCFHQLVAKR